MHSNLERAMQMVEKNNLGQAAARLKDHIAFLGGGHDPDPWLPDLRMKQVDIAARAATLSDLPTTQRLAASAEVRAAVLKLIEDLHSISPPMQVVPIPQEPVSFEAPKESRLELTWGLNTLQSIAWLHRGLRAAKAVCRIVTPRGSGSGFMIAPGRIVTNNHVIALPKEAAESFAEFNYEEDETGRLLPITTYRFDAKHFVTSKDLDCTVIDLASDPDQKPFAEWGELAFEDNGRLAIGDHVSVIQHAGGELKKIAVTANEVVSLNGHRLQYMTETLPGSSGSPVLNDRWKVVALHARGGTPIESSRREVTYANEGTLGRSILADPELGLALTRGRA
jgi:V8-like Glu-specific endopeptidase